MKPLESLKKGLKKLKKQVECRVKDLQAQLKQGEKISEADENWLDNNGNLVDEERVVEALDQASDYERGLQRMDTKEKEMVEKLQALGGGPKAVTLKRKRQSSPFPSKSLLTPI
jgi:ASC-1-like (ASCH) protein